MKSILVRAPNWIGDQILAYPFFYYLRKTYPKARIHVVCVPWVLDLQFRGLVDEVTVLPVSRKQTLFTRLKVIRAIAQELSMQGPWEMAVSLPNSWSAAMLAYLSKATIRIGYKTEGRGILLNRGVRWNSDPKRHRAQAYLDLLNGPLGQSYTVDRFWPTLPKDEFEENLPGEQTRFDFQNQWKIKGVLQIPSEPYWIIAPGATADSRRWDQGYFASLARKIRSSKGWTGVIVGGKAEKKLAQELCRHEDLKLLDMTDMGPVAELAPLFQKAMFTVSNESGLAHVAALCGSPVQIVCGAADPRRTTPLGPGKVQVAFNPVNCWPCEKNVCFNEGATYLQCLSGITPDRVFEEVSSVTRGV